MWSKKNKLDVQNNLVFYFFVFVENQKLGVTLPPCGQMTQVVKRGQNIVILMLFFYF